MLRQPATHLRQAFAQREKSWAKSWERLVRNGANMTWSSCCCEKNCSTGEAHPDMTRPPEKAHSPHSPCNNQKHVGKKGLYINNNFEKRTPRGVRQIASSTVHEKSVGTQVRQKARRTPCTAIKSATQETPPHVQVSLYATCVI